MLDIDQMRAVALGSLEWMDGYTHPEETGGDRQYRVTLLGRFNDGLQVRVTGCDPDSGWHNDDVQEFLVRVEVTPVVSADISDEVEEEAPSVQAGAVSG